MTSVQNLLQLLSGNKIGRFMAICLFALFSFSAEAQYDEDDEDSNSSSSITDSHPFAHLASSDFAGQKLYNIVFVLPVRKEDGSTNKDGLSYWEGVNVALERIKKLKSKFKIHLWDNYKSDSVTKDIIKKNLLNMKVDAIVAPFHTRQALIIAEYCKNNKIPMFLALNPSDAVVKNNPYVFKLIPSKNRVFYNIYKDITSDTTQKDAKIFYIYDSSSKMERRVANYLRYASEKDQTNRLNLMPINEISTLIPKLNMEGNNILMVSQYKDAQVNEIIGSLKDVAAPIKVYGNSAWVNNFRINKENLAALNTLIYSDFYLRKNSEEFEYVKKKYFEMASDNINPEVFQGYDLINYITQIIELYGRKFPLYADKYEYKGVSTNIRFEPMYSSDGSRILFYENTYKDILKAYPEGWFRINEND